LNIFEKVNKNEWDGMGWDGMGKGRGINGL
jgi:hypothetical protein